MEAPHIATLALRNPCASVFAAVHVRLLSTLAGTVSAPDLVAVTVGDDALLSALRPFPFVAAVDLLAAGRFPAVVEAGIAHAAVAVLGPPHLGWAVVHIVGINGARTCIGVILPAGTAVDFLALFQVVVPVSAVFADTAALALAPGLRRTARGSLAPLRPRVPLLVSLASRLGIDASPSLLGPDLLVTAEALRRSPRFVFLALAARSRFDTLVGNGAGLLGGAVIVLGEATTAVLEPGGEVVGWALLLGAGGLFPEAAAPVISPVAFLLTDALQLFAVVLLQEAAT